MERRDILAANTEGMQVLGEPFFLLVFVGKPRRKERE
jgi:hypothetical protein